MDHCQHLGRETEGSCADAPNRNDSGARIARLPSDRKFDDRWLQRRESPAAKNDLQSIQANLEFSRPLAQPSAWVDQRKDRGLQIVGLLPLFPELSSDGMHETLMHTVLTKVVKSQQWLRATHIVPQDFIIFAWLPLAC